MPYPRPTLFIPMMGDSRTRPVGRPHSPLSINRSGTHTHAKRRVPKGPIRSLPPLSSNQAVRYSLTVSQGERAPFPIGTSIPIPTLFAPFTPSVGFPLEFLLLFFSGSALTITSRPRTKARIESAVFLFEGEKPKAEAEQISFGGIAPASRHYVHLWNGNVLRVRSSLASIGSHWCSRQWSICSHDSPLHPVPYCPFTQCR